MSSPSFFQLPEELISTLFSSYPGREPQIRALASLVHPHAAPCRNLIIHGTEATGKTAITASLLELLRQDGENSNLKYTLVKSTECVTSRHLFERTVAAVADALLWEAPLGRCETLAALTVELSKLLKYVERDGGWRFVLVFDTIDRQREAPPTLLPALARLSEIIPNLTTVFIVTAPLPSLLRTPSTPHIHFPPYTKSQYIAILSMTPPTALPNTSQQETTDLYARFVAVVHESLSRAAGRTLPSVKHAVVALWSRFTAPVLAGTHKAREFSKLLVAARVWLQDESVLAPGIVVASAGSTSSSSGAPAAAAVNGTAAATPKKRSAATGGGVATASASMGSSTTDLSTLLPPTAKLLLVAAYLASHNTPRHDQTLFSTWHYGGRRRRGGGAAGLNSSQRGPRAKHRKIARKLLGPGVFTLERMVAIYVALRREQVGSHGPGGGDGKLGAAAGVDADVGMGIATLASLRLLVRVGAGAGAGDMDRGGRWRIGVSWEIVRGVGRSLGIEVEDWLVE
ncbi:origin recognition complex subunit 5 C-terminus-domain-containing protein [Xylariales sp. PMI_506]|nr:origin recognition complex subunit 5 C-terminus-domain-containing protein [Xylariales sp. PMI_506]